MAIFYQTLSHTAYEEQRYQMIKLVEEGGQVSLLPYLDSQGIPTIGIGMNIQNPGFIQDAVLGGIFGQSLPSALKAGLIAELAESHSSSADLQTDLNAVLSNWNAANPNQPVESIFAFEDEQDVKVTFDSISTVFEASLTGQIPGIPDSMERLVLFSLEYNGILNDSPSLKSAVASGNRAEAWYEIRYDSNDGSSAGEDIAKRRYYESEKFGLYNNPDTVSLDEAIQVLRMYTVHRDDKILDYDHRYGAQVGQAEQDYGASVSTREESLRAAKLVLTQANGLTLDVDENEFLVGTDNGESLSDGDSHLYNPHEDDVIFGLSGDDTLTGGAGKDLLFGGSGRDSLYGGDGNDKLEGGDGNDTLEGGDGKDILRGGDGDDHFILFASKVAADDLDDVNSIDGGSGSDTADYRLSTTNLNITMGGIDNTRDILNGIENIILTDYNDIVGGTSQNNTFVGRGGNDWFSGYDGDDLLDGDDLNDPTVIAGNDQMDGDRGNDTLLGGAGNDFLSGGPGADLMEGGAGDDVIYSNSLFKASADVDTVYGGAGNDIIHIGAATGQVAYGGDGDDHIFIQAPPVTDSSQLPPVGVVTGGRMGVEGGSKGGLFSDGRGGKLDKFSSGNGDVTVYGGNGMDTIHVNSQDKITIIDSDGRFALNFLDKTFLDTYYDNEQLVYINVSPDTGWYEYFWMRDQWGQSTGPSYLLNVWTDERNVIIGNMKAIVHESLVSVVNGMLVFDFPVENPTLGAENSSGFAYSLS